jgi:integrase
MGERSGHAINKDRKNMAAAWTWGINTLEGFPRMENPFLAVPKKPEEKQPRYVPPMDDFWRVYTHVEQLAADGDDRNMQDRVMLLAYLHLAARRSELFKAKWSDVDFANSQIRLGTRKREGGLEYDWLPLTTELHADLLMWAQRRLAHSTMDKEHLFVCLSPLPCCDLHYGLPFRQRRWTMGKWCDKAKVKPFGWHAIRHLTALELYRHGYSVKHIQAVLRHQRATTTDIYLRSLGVGQALRETLNNGLSRDNLVVLKQKKTASGGQT